MKRHNLTARVHRCANNCAPRLVVFLACSLLIFLLFPHTRVSAHTGVSQTSAQKHALAGRATSAGHISGQLLNGSHNNAPVANQSVTLQMAQGNSSRDLVTITTDAQGRYAFGSLESDSSTQYALYTSYQGAQYVSDLIDLSKKADQQVNLTVYDATSSTANIAVVQASILIAKPNQQSGRLTISEDFIFENLSNMTYVGRLDASHGKPNALLFSLPAGAGFLSLGPSFNGYTTTQVNTGFASNAAVPPGTSEFSFSFQVPYSNDNYQFTYKAIYPTVVLSLLTPTSILTTPQGLTAKGPTNTQSGTFQMFQGKTLTANSSVGARLDHLPPPDKATPQQSGTNPGLLWVALLLIALMILAGIGGYIYNARRRGAASSRGKPTTRAKTPQSSSKKAPAATKEALLQELLELDKAYESGKLKKSAYQEQRAQLKARLRTLMDKQSAKSADTVEQGDSTKPEVVKSAAKGAQSAGQKTSKTTDKSTETGQKAGKRSAEAAGKSGGKGRK